MHETPPLLLCYENLIYITTSELVHTCTYLNSSLWGEIPCITNPIDLLVHCFAATKSNIPENTEDIIALVRYMMYVHSLYLVHSPCLPSILCILCMEYYHIAPDPVSDTKTVCLCKEREACCVGMSSTATDPENNEVPGKIYIPVLDFLR